MHWHQHQVCFDCALGNIVHLWTLSHACSCSFSSDWTYTDWKHQPNWCSQLIATHHCSRWWTKFWLQHLFILPIELHVLAIIAQNEYVETDDVYGGQKRGLGETQFWRWNLDHLAESSYELNWSHNSYNRITVYRDMIATILSYSYTSYF